MATPTNVVFLDQRRKRHHRDALDRKQLTLVDPLLNRDFQNDGMIRVDRVTPSDPVRQLILFDEVWVYVVHVEVSVVVRDGGVNLRHTFDVRQRIEIVFDRLDR